MTVHAQDHDLLQRMLGQDGVTPAVIREADIWTKLYHRSGASGPMGLQMLIPLVRSLGLGVRDEHSVPERVDWRAYPQDGSVSVEVQMFGGWLPGVFLGFSEHGMLAVRLDGERVVKEIRKDICRIPAPAEADSFPDETPAAAALLMNAVSQSATVAAEPVDAPDADIADDDDSILINAPADYPWEDATPGDQCWVGIDGDVLDGVFKSFDLHTGMVIVEVGEAEHRLLPTQVQHIPSKDMAGSGA